MIALPYVLTVGLLIYYAFAVYQSAIHNRTTRDETKKALAALEVGQRELAATVERIRGEDEGSMVLFEVELKAAGLSVEKDEAC